ncbi:cyanoexosortase A [Tolypothrix sp. FACHB-123]|uniref:cyanoexosortase A n=1 Tax=Tolypothrix sp. FACHB-123 TaxID=2692868 RepID=UPI0016878270|nr:cyanoexosortase A [Tolypothrix sp. FACHB-123]MBD2353608.1 cyanoexosortase A [Tolypothrix sp. FACHB-123]
MNITHLKSAKILKTEPFWLLSIAAGLAAICLTLVWKAHDVGHLGMSILFFFAIGSILWDKRHTFNFESDVFSSILGWLIISWVLWQSTTHNLGYVIRLFPLASAVGVGLLASGFRGLKQYWEAFTILFFLEIPSVLAELLLDISPLSAKFASLLLWYSGFDVTLKGVYIHLPTGSVKVVPSCSGIDTINYLLGISIIALVMFPIAKYKRVFVSLFAMFLGFFLNAIRIAILAVMVGTNEAAFHSWHGGNASYSFGVFGILIFGVIYMLILRQEERQMQKTEQS